MKQNILSILILIGALVLVGVYGHLSAHDTVVAVLDANSLELSRGRVVHLIGVHAENEVRTVLPATGADHGGAESAEEEVLAEEVAMKPELRERMENRLLGQWVNLEFTSEYEGDHPTPDLFAYVHMKGDLDVNGWLIEQGYVRHDRTFDHPRSETYSQLQQQAMSEGVGIWLKAHGGGTLDDGDPE